MIHTIEHFEELVKTSESFVCKNCEIEGSKVKIFSYLFADFSEFKKYEHLGSFECRGITFVQDDKTGQWEKHLLLEKFFNVNENEDWLLEKLSKYEIKSLQNKVDGSVISFIKFPNGNIVAKSKASFISDQAIAANKIYKENKNLISFIEFCNKNKLTPIFEFIAPTNQIVLYYDEYDLVLLQVRDENGNYKSKDNILDYANRYNLNYSKYEELTDLTSLIERCQVEEDKEGYVIDFGHVKAKLKTKWYVERHKVIGENNLRENVVIESVLNGIVDDILAYLIPGTYKYDFIANINSIVNKRFNEHFKQVNEMVKQFSTFESRKDFALKYKKDPLFGIVMGIVIKDNKNIKGLIKSHILRRTSKLKQAREWLEVNNGS